MLEKSTTFSSLETSNNHSSDNDNYQIIRPVNCPTSYISYVCEAEVATQSPTNIPQSEEDKILCSYLNTMMSRMPNDTFGHFSRHAKPTMSHRHYPRPIQMHKELPNLNHHGRVWQQAGIPNTTKGNSTPSLNLVNMFKRLFHR